MIKLKIVFLLSLSILVWCKSNSSSFSGFIETSGKYKISNEVVLAVNNDGSEVTMTYSLRDQSKKSKDRYWVSSQYTYKKYWFIYVAEDQSIWRCFDGRVKLEKVSFRRSENIDPLFIGMPIPQVILDKIMTKNK